MMDIMTAAAPIVTLPFDGVRVASTSLLDPELAAQQLFRQLDLPTLSGCVIFASSRYDLPALAEALALRSEGITMIGCTSSGEITPDGFAEGTITAIGFPESAFSLRATRFSDLDHFDPADAQRRVRGLVADAVERSNDWAQPIHRVALFLVDGLSHREEMLTITVQDALGDIPLIGGSSGDGLAFRETFVFHDGAFHRDSAIVAILSTPRKLSVFRSQYYAPGSIKMVVTGADPANRIVTEINAEPAAEEYGRLVGASVAALGPSIFASRPPMVRAGGEYYVRSIQSANADGSLTFYCAIDEGIVLTLGEARDVVSGLETLFDGLEQAVNGIDRVLGFDCVLNSVEIEQRQLSRVVSGLFAQRRVVGFNTYGEQFHGLHVNQTFSGLAIGR